MHDVAGVWSVAVSEAGILAVAVCAGRQLVERIHTLGQRCAATDSHCICCCSLARANFFPALRRLRWDQRKPRVSKDHPKVGHENKEGLRPSPSQHPVATAASRRAKPLPAHISTLAPLRVTTPPPTSRIDYWHCYSSRQCNVCTVSCRTHHASLTTPTHTIATQLTSGAPSPRPHAHTRTRTYAHTDVHIHAHTHSHTHTQGTAERKM